MKEGIAMQAGSVARAASGGRAGFGARGRFIRRWLRRLSPLLVLAVPGCILTSGQITVSFDLPNPIHVVGPTRLVAAPVDLNTIGDYADHKDDLKDLTDVAILGDVTASTALDVEFWVTPGLTTYLLATEVRSNGILLWGPLGVPAQQTLRLDWNGSAGRFTDGGREALLGYVKGDGKFTVYALSSSPSFDFSVDYGVVVIVLDAGI